MPVLRQPGASCPLPRSAGRFPGAGKASTVRPLAAVIVYWSRRKCHYRRRKGRGQGVHLGRLPGPDHRHPTVSGPPRWCGAGITTTSTWPPNCLTSPRKTTSGHGSTGCAHRRRTLIRRGHLVAAQAERWEPGRRQKSPGEPEPIEDRLAAVAGPRPPVWGESVFVPGTRQFAQHLHGDRRAGFAPGEPALDVVFRPEEIHGASSEANVIPPAGRRDQRSGVHHRVADRAPSIRSDSPQSGHDVSIRPSSCRAAHMPKASQAQFPYHHRPAARTR